MVDSLLSGRAKKVFREIEQDSDIEPKPDLLLLANSTAPMLDNSFFYMTDLAEGLFEQSYLLATRDGSISILTSPMEKLLVDKSSSVEVSTYLDRSELSEKLTKLAKSIKTKVEPVIGVNFGELTVESVRQNKVNFQGFKICRREQFSWSSQVDQRSE